MSDEFGPIVGMPARLAAQATAPALSHAPAPATLAESLLLQVLTGQSVIEQRVARTEVQNETILTRLDHADTSRARLHTRVDEIAVNVSRLDAASDTQGERLDALAPIVDKLKEANIESNAVRKAIVAVLKNPYARSAGAMIAGGTVISQWEWLIAALKRIGAKFGGP